jgi:hypothetical protein
VRKLLSAIICCFFAAPCWCSTSSERIARPSSETPPSVSEPSEVVRDSVQVRVGTPEIAGRWVGLSHQKGVWFDEKMELELEQNGDFISGCSVFRSKQAGSNARSLSGRYLAGTDSFVLTESRFLWKHLALLATPILDDQIDLRVTNNGSRMVGTWAAFNGAITGKFNLERATELNDKATQTNGVTSSR